MLETPTMQKHIVEFIWGVADGEIIQTPDVSRLNNVYYVAVKTTPNYRSFEINGMPDNTEHVKTQKYVLFFIKSQNRYAYFHDTTYNRLKHLLKQR